MKNPYPLILTMFLAACRPVILPTSATITPSPYTTHTPTAFVTQTITPIPATPDIDATATMFRQHMINVCPTATPSGPAPFMGFLSHTKAFTEFIGVYRYGTGHSVHDLVVDCDNRYYEKTWVDFGALRFESGTASIQEGNLFVLDTIDQSGRMQQRVYLPVRWGPRHYLVPYPDKTEDFCKALAQRDRSLEGGVGYFFLRIGDEELEASGDPVIPAGQKVCP